MDYKVSEVSLSYKNTVPYNERQRIDCTMDACKLARSIFSEETIDYKEFFKVICLNTSLQVLGYFTVSEGGISSTPVDIRLIFQGALLMNATKIIVTHNHPSGKLTPSSCDNKLTSKIREAGELLSIQLLDHIIVTRNDSYSYSQNGDI